MVDLKNHPGFWLNAAAAASLERYEDDRGVQGLNSAGRHEWEQQEFIDRWDRGGWQNRPPYLYNPMRPAWKGAHVKDGGNAIDLSTWREFLKRCDEYGWVQTYAWDVVHFEYFPHRDKHRNRPASAPAVVDPVIPVGEEEEDDMAKNVMHHHDHPTYAYEVSISNPDSGFYLSYVTNDPETNNAFAEQYETGSSVKVSDSMFRVVRESTLAVAPRNALQVVVADADA